MVSDINKAYDELRQPPKWALREIKDGPLKGKTDINPQWRYEAMTKAFGLVGFGWKYSIDKLWREDGANGEVLCFAQVSVYVKEQENLEWSDPIVGIGGSKLVNNFSTGLKNNDEGYKMAITDAFSTALKMLGVAADIYAGRWDGSKYTAPGEDESAKPTKQGKTAIDPESKAALAAEAEQVFKRFEELADKGLIAQDSLDKMHAAYVNLKGADDYKAFMANARKNIRQAEKALAEVSKAGSDGKDTFKDDDIPF